MRAEPISKRAIAFIDGQNLFHAAKAAFGYTIPNYDPKALAELVCARYDWNLCEIRFYTGVPRKEDNLFWSTFWSSKLLSMSRQGVTTYSRKLKYRDKAFAGPEGRTYTRAIGEEKGIDVRIAIDVISCVVQDKCDVVLIFSQDQDLSEVAEEIRLISKKVDRWIKVASAFPFSASSKNRRGINKTDWVKIERAEYDMCIDPRNHCPPKI